MQFRVNLKFGVAAALFITLNGAANADVYEYSYTGKPYDAFATGSGVQELTSDNHFSFSFETSSPISANTEYSFSDVLFWTFSDGTNYLNSDDASLFMPATFVDTNSLGQIGLWNLIVISQATPDKPSITANSCGPVLCLESIPFYKYAGEYEQITPLVGRFLYAAAASTPGTWSGPTDITAVPEPTPLTILSAGIAALWLAIRRYPRRLGSQGG